MLSEQYLKETWSVKAAAAIAHRKAVSYSSAIETVTLAAARARNVLGISNVQFEEAPIGQAFGVIMHEGDVFEYVASGAVTLGDKLCPLGSAGDLGTARIGDEYIGIALETLADGETGRAVFSRGVVSGEYPMISGTLAAVGSISSVFPEAGTYQVDITIVNTTTNAVTGGVNIGTTQGGTDIASGTAVGASAVVRISAAVKVTAAKSLYVDAASAWNSASLTIYPCVKKLA